MIKRIVSLGICMLLLLTIAVGEELEDEYTLPEKFMKQVSLGSGLKGIAKFAVSGSEHTAGILQPLDGAEFNWSFISKDELVEAEIKTEKNGQQGATTQIYGDGKKIYFGSDLFQGTVYELEANGDFLTSIVSENNQAPSFYLPLLKTLLTVNENDAVKKSTEKIFGMVQEWMDAFALSPEYITEENVSFVKICYQIPADDLRNEMKRLLHELLYDSDLMTVLRQNSSEQQKEIYLDKDLEWYYCICIDQIDLKDAAVYERKVTLQGEEVESKLELPLSAKFAPWTSFILKKGLDTEYTLTGEKGTVQLRVQEYVSSNEGLHVQGVVWSDIPSEKTGKGLSLAFDVHSQITLQNDEEGYQHEYQTWQYTLQNAQIHTVSDSEEKIIEYLQIPVIQGALQLHYYSKAAKRAATTLEVSLNTAVNGGRLQGAAKMRTTSPWDITPMETDYSVKMSEMNYKDRMVILTDLFSNTLLDLHMIDMETQLQSKQIQVEKVLATATDIDQ